MHARHHERNHHNIVFTGLRAQGVSPYDCVASSGDGIYQLVLTDSDGCPADGSTIVSQLKGHNGVLKSEPFELFAFAGQNNLQIYCSFQFCFTAEDPLCTDRCTTRRMARLTTTSYHTADTTSSDYQRSCTTDYYYWYTSPYYYWSSPSYWYRKKREANATEFATAQVEIIKESTSTVTKQTASMAANNTAGLVAWATLLFLAFLRFFKA
ncbi:uncharacterized protein LOC112573763 [Pomacea canaliculata]|uniref:uncharacterized protein LOC112573763 n=1 Tax=Pomacea canaliculata TaxID=400727 RepID=UPI000D739902|nr:uncharacterized protein LOC112573763 [Pomacea canaliculata]